MSIIKKVKEREQQKLEYYKKASQEFLSELSDDQIQTLLTVVIKDKVSPKIQSENAREALANLLAQLIYKQVELLNKTEEQINYLIENYENQRRLSEALREKNFLIQNYTNFLNLLSSVFIEKKSEIPAQINININRLMPETENIEDYVDYLPEGEL